MGACYADRCLIDDGCVCDRMDKDGTLKIDWEEWRNYLLLSATANLHDMLHYWRHASVCHLD